MNKEKGYILFELTIVILIIGIMIGISTPRYSGFIERVNSIESKIKNNF